MIKKNNCIKHDHHKAMVFKCRLLTEEKKGDVAPGLVAGYASLFDVVDEHNDRIVRGAFYEHLQEVQKTNRMPKMLWQHQSENVIGSWTKIKEDSQGLYVQGQLALEVQKAREAYQLLKTGAIDGLSIGFQIRKSIKGGNLDSTRLITDLELFEVSLVTFPANVQARISSVS